MIKSGRNVPTPAMPIPDLAVPYAAPMPMVIHLALILKVAAALDRRERGNGVVHPKTIAAAIPPYEIGRAHV